MRDGTLALIQSLEAWRGERAIRLHTLADSSGRRYGPRIPAEGYVDPIHVKHLSNGHYAVAARADAQIWLDCGRHPDSLFQAVLDALQLKDVLEHRALMDALGTDGTEAQRLRKAVLEKIKREPTEAALVLLPMGAWVNKRYGAVDAFLMQELAEVERSLSHTEAARLFNVGRTSLMMARRADRRAGQAAAPRGDTVPLDTRAALPRADTPLSPDLIEFAEELGAYGLASPECWPIDEDLAGVVDDREPAWLPVKRARLGQDP